ncbi:MAG: hypothetical protein E3J73_06630 [Candidatus Bathyarchaeum sp.]|nr:MAG: hypothetical protein E3J73_06630 [Candidatus Bathyarchaeum sp.]
MVNPCDVKEKADAVLRLLKSTVEGCSFNLVLLRGTCLGLYRDVAFIEKDNDIDIGILSDHKECTPEEKRFVKEKLLKAGFKCPNPVDLAGQEHWWAHNADILICIRWTFEYPDIPTFSQLRFLHRFDYVIYNNEIYNIPHPIGDYLEYFYPPSLYGGADWRTPHLKSP